MLRKSEGSLQTIPIETLDFLRGIAAVYVLINHCRGAFFAGGSVILANGDATLLDYLAIAALRTTSLGKEFVILFFVISGFSMAHSMRYTSDPRRFYLKRLIRIWPPYLAAVALAVFVSIVTQADQFGSVRRVAEVALYIDPSTHVTPQFWSLPYEIIFYALCPLVLTSRRAMQAFLAIASVSTVIFVAIYGVNLNPSASTALNFVGNCALFFALGAATYYYLDRVPRCAFPALAVGVVVVLAVVSFVKLRFFGGESNIPLSLLMCAITALLIRNWPTLPQWARPLNFGRFSYSIYVFHYAFIFAIGQLLSSRFGIVQEDMTSYWMWILSVPPILLCCYLLYLVTERPCNALVGRIRKAGAPAAVSGP